MHGNTEKWTFTGAVKIFVMEGIPHTNIDNASGEKKVIESHKPHFAMMPKYEASWDRAHHPNIEAAHAG